LLEFAKKLKTYALIISSVGSLQRAVEKLQLPVPNILAHMPLIAPRIFDFATTFHEFKWFPCQ